jgi:alanine racemase
MTPSAAERPAAASTGLVPDGQRAALVIDLDAIADNVARIDEVAGSAHVMAVVKADAYGHGLIPSARAARAGGASWLGVALLDEALDLRAAGDSDPILAWLGVPGDKWTDAVRASIDLGVSSTWQLDEIVPAALATGRPARIHLKLDTGLSRNGATTADWPALIAAVNVLQADGLVDVVAVWSHFVLADSPSSATVAQQLRVFDEGVEYARAHGVHPPLRHIANSAATFALPQAHYELVRPGIAVYGLSPGGEVGAAKEIGIRPAMTLAARLSLAKHVPAGQGVSYGHEYVTTTEANLGLVPLGYADGIPRAAGNCGPLLGAGARRKIAGRVCMDQFVVDFGGDHISAGDEVVLFGSGDAPSADDWAAVTGTINYEIVTRIGPRVPRRFVGTAGVVGTSGGLRGAVD